MATFRRDTSGFTVREGRETLQVEAWGDNSVRVRSTLGPCITETPGSALTEPGPAQFSVEISDDRARMRNGDLVVEVSSQDDSSFLGFPPLLRFFGSTGEELFSESVPHFSAPPQRRYAPAGGDLSRCEVTFDAFPGERIYGLGQHQHGLLDQKGAVIELIQRNTEVCIPFALSNRGYGFFWNMAGVGRGGLGHAPPLRAARAGSGFPPCCRNGLRASGSASSVTGPSTSFSRSRASTSAVGSLSPSSSSITSIGPVKASGDLIPPSGRTRKRWLTSSASWESSSWFPFGPL